MRGLEVGGLRRAADACRSYSSGGEARAGAISVCVSAARHRAHSGRRVGPCIRSSRQHLTSGSREEGDWGESSMWRGDCVSIPSPDDPCWQPAGRLGFCRGGLPSTDRPYRAADEQCTEQ